MENNFVPYNLALELKKLGFDEECLAFYSAYPKEERKFMIVSEFRTTKKLFLKNDYGLNTVTAPLWQQAFDWFREKYNLCSSIGKCTYVCEPKELFGFTIGSVTYKPVNWNTYKHYQEARQVCLEKLIEICKNK